MDSSASEYRVVVVCESTEFATVGCGRVSPISGRRTTHRMIAVTALFKLEQEYSKALYCFMLFISKESMETIKAGQLC